VNIAKQKRTRFWLFVIAGILALAAVAFGTRKLYKKIEAPRLAKRAIALLQKGDNVGASLSLRQALILDPENSETARLVAEVADKGNDPNALVWRARVLELQPHSLDAVLPYARTALRTQQLTAATNALEKAAGIGGNSAEYHTLFGQVAAAGGNPALAVEHYSQAIRLDPKNQQLSLEYSQALLDRGWLEDQTTARTTLEQLAADPQFAVKALRPLVRNAMAVGEVTRALRLARSLATDPQATFDDRLPFLDLLHRTEDPQFPSYLESLQKAARDQPYQVTAIGLWMNENQLTGQVLQWSETFSATEWASPQVCAAVAFAALSARDWPRLQALTGPGNWTGLEHIHAALHARALREQGDLGGSNKSWTDAYNAAAKLPHSAVELARLTAEWGWDDESAELFKAAIDDPALGPAAARAVLPYLARKKDTKELWRATGKLHEADPKNDVLTNNFAMYSLLLRKDLSRACELAQTVAARHPRDPAYVSTQAYALHYLGKTAEAIDAMNTLDPMVLTAPDSAAYYGIFLAAKGDFPKAAQFLDLAATANLLPEESELVRTARNAVLEASLLPAGMESKAEFLRLAALARALRTRGDDAGSHAKWEAALAAAQKEPHGPAELAQAIQDWGWDVEFDQLLTASIKDPKYGAWACHTLWPRLLAKRSTTALWNVSNQLLQFEPQDVKNTANFIRFSLLLENDVVRATQLAQTLYGQQPANAAIGASYAYALCMGKRTAEALKIVNALDPVAAQEPWIALDYAMVLTAAGEASRARKFLDAATAGDTLLSEEATMAIRTRVALEKAAAENKTP